MGIFNLFGVYVLVAHNFYFGVSDHASNLFIYPSGYVKTDAPRNNNSEKGPYVISVDVEMWAINEICLRRQDLEVDLTLNVRWVDPRLAVNPNITSKNLWPVLSKNEIIGKLWTPTLLFRNCKGCKELSLGNGHALYVNKANGRVLGQIRLQNRFTCSIDLRAYPMDIQFCQLQLYTYEDTEDVLQLHHRYPEKYVTIDSHLNLAEYNIAPIIKTQCIIEDVDGDAFSCLAIKIRLEHRLGYHLMTSYAPTSFIVALSWISFWLPLDLAPARVALGLTSLLTLATRLDQAQKDLPPVAYVKAIDVWMFACIFLVSMSLCEFAFSHYREEVRKMRFTVHRTVKVQAMTVKEAELVTKTKTSASKPSSTGQSTDSAGTSFDRISRVLFPSTFLVFNIVYWSYYSTYYH